MATFYPSSTDQKKTPANLYLRDPAGPEPVASSNMVYFNFSPVGSYSNSFAGSREPQANCIGVSYLSSSHLGENAYSSWRAGGGSFDVGDELLRVSATEDDPHMSLQTQLRILDEHNLSLQQSMSGGQGQGLSLRLGMQIPVSNPANGEISNGSASPYELRKTTVLDSKYIKAAQQLLDEVVNLQKALKQKADNVKSIQACRGGNEASRSDGNCANSPGELSPSEKQELQNKMIKLLAMLDEVDRRYKRYFNEMQIVDSSFDTIAGSGAAKPYTALALQTISQHFRCLRDAIGSQIRSSQKLLGEQDGSNGKGCGISRLRYIDQHIRQQRAMQQYGVMPQHAWRPQRGLPENSVSILRAWLFEHFLHPYPNDSEKLMLAKQTGLTRSQISNWFINARVRLWKPMVEDIYKEEFGENEMDSNSSSEIATKFMDELTNNAQETQQSPSNERCQTNQSDPPARPPAFQNEPTDQRTHDPSGINPLLLHDAIYHADETSRYDNGGGVSLTLGLQHCEGNLPASEAQEEFLASPSIAFGPSQLLKYFVA